jgi:hypothetical protein
MRTRSRVGSDVGELKLSCVQRVAIGSVASSKWASWRTAWREAAPARPVKPTSTVPAERFQRAVGIEHFDAGARLEVNVVDWLMGCALHGGSLHRCQRCLLQQSRGLRVLCPSVRDAESDGNHAKSFRALGDPLAGPTVATILALRLRRMVHSACRPPLVIRTALISLTLVPVGPVRTRSPIPAKKL